MGSRWRLGVADALERGLSLRTLLLAIVVVLTLPPLTLEAVLLRRDAASERARAAALLEENAKGTANLIDGKFAAAEAMAKALAASPLLDKGDFKAYEAQLRRVTAETGKPFLLVDPAGVQLINTYAPEGSQLPRSDVSRWARVFTKKRPYVTEVFKGSLTGKLSAAVVVPVVREGAVKWTLVISLYGKDFSNVLADPGVPSRWVVSVVDQDGTHLVRSRRSEENAGRPLEPELVGRLKRNETGTFRTTTLEGIPVISTVARAPRSGWAVAIGRPVAELEAPLAGQLRALLMSGLLIVGLGLVIAWLVTRQIGTAVDGFAARAQALARGEPLPPNRRSLVLEATTINTELAKAAEILAEREQALRELNASLGEQVGSRTAALSASNADLRAEMLRRERSEQQFSMLVQGVVDYALLLLQPDGTVATWNAGAERMNGYTAGEVIGRHFRCFYTQEDQAAQLPEKALKIAASEGRNETEGWRVRKDGERFWVHVVVDAIHNDAGELTGFAKITRDVTQRRQAEEALKKAQNELAQAQKMEATGQLTGGIAHDFNNMLAVILASARLLNTRLARGEDVQQFIDGIREAAERGATLTQRLLAFARRQPLAPEPVDANELVREMFEIFRRTIPETIQTETVLAGSLWTTRVDPHALESALLNLVTNACDAMPNGGKLTIETGNVDLDDAYASAQAEVVTGQYVLIAVADTGVGMDSEARQRAFEPFFTTKLTGQGTGLGLSQVFGFAKQSGGHVRIFSEVGQGTTIKLYLPRMQAGAVRSAKKRAGSADLALARNNETVLVVEDEEQVGKLITEMLAELGYRTLSARTAEEALEVLARTSVHVMVTDVVMPGMNGRELAELAAKRHPTVKVVFMTGYTRDAIVNRGQLEPGVVLLTKPFSIEMLGQKLREVLLE